MSTVELKRQIIEKLSSIEDEVILHEIYDLIKMESGLELVYKLTEAEKKAIDAGLKDLKEGKIVSSEKADDLIKSWLKK